MWAYIFGAVCPRKGEGVGLVLPDCDTGSTNQHLTEIPATVDPGAHAVPILDRASWHGTPRLVPADITLLFLPPRAPEPNPVENVWQFLRDNGLSNRVFIDHEHIVALLRSLERARRSALENHLHRHARLGASV